MNTYPVPPDIREKEKVVGGILTVSQTVFVVIGVVLALINVQFIISHTHNILLAILGILPSVPIIAVGVITKHDYGEMELSQFLIYQFFFKRSKKEFPNINENFRG